MSTSKGQNVEEANGKHPGASSAKPTQGSRGRLTKSALTRRTSLSIPSTISVDEWRNIGRHLFIISDSSGWWLGDWLVYGQSQYPDRYRQAIAETSLDYQTLRNYAWVARQFSVTRRRDRLSFQHHAELASLPESEQEEWLDRAEKFGWSRNMLRNRLRASRSVDRKRDEVVSFQMSVVGDQKQLWQDAAAAADKDLLSWIFAVLDDAASAS